MGSELDVWVMDCHPKRMFLRVEVGTIHYAGATGVNWAGLGASEIVTLTVDEDRVEVSPPCGQHMSKDLYQAMEIVHAAPGCV